MRRPPRNLYVEADVRRACGGNLRYGALAVEHNRFLGAQHREIQVARTHKPYLFFARERHLNAVTRHAVFINRFQRLQYRRNAALAIAAQNRSAVGHYSIAVNAGLNASTRLHRVHMRRQQYRIRPAVVGDDVAVSVPLYAEAKRFQAARQLHRHRLFFPRRAVNLNKIRECLYQAVAVYHPISPYRKLAIETLGILYVVCRACQVLDLTAHWVINYTQRD